MKPRLCNEIFGFFTGAHFRVGSFPAPIGGTKTFTFDSAKSRSRDFSLLIYTTTGVGNGAGMHPKRSISGRTRQVCLLQFSLELASLSKDDSLHVRPQG